MEMGYCQLRQKDVINVKDGKKLGKITDVIFAFPEGRITGFIVPECCGFFQPEIFINACNIVKVGEDTILVDIPALCKSSARRRDHMGQTTVPPQSPPGATSVPPRYFEDEE